MNLRSSRPDCSPEGIARRRRTSANSKALLQHQGYRHDPFFEDIRERWVIGELSDDEYQTEILKYCDEIAARANGR